MVGGFVKRSTGIILLAMLSHFAVDATTVAAMVRTESDMWTIGVAILLYDALAFATQPLFGLFADRRRASRFLLAGGLILAGMGSILFQNALVIAIVCGFGNAAAHIGGFGVMFPHTEKKIAPLGLFVSAGALGLGVGTLFSTNHLYYAILSLALGILVLLLKLKAPAETETEQRGSTEKPVLIIPLIAVLLGVFLRGFTGTLASGEYSKTTLQGLFVYFAIFAGKAVGGFLADSLGLHKTVLFFFLPSVVGLLWFRGTEWIFLLSIGLFNISMPLCLALAIRLLRRLPAFAFGVTAALLMIGTFFALFVSPIGLVKNILIVLSALFSAGFMIYAIQMLKKEELPCVF